MTEIGTLSEIHDYGNIYALIGHPVKVGVILNNWRKANNMLLYAHAVFYIHNKLWIVSNMLNRRYMYARIVYIWSYRYILFLC